MNLRDYIGKKLKCVNRYNNPPYFRWERREDEYLGKELGIIGTVQWGVNPVRKYFEVVHPDVDRGRDHLMPIQCFDLEEEQPEMKKEEKKVAKKKDDAIKVGDKVRVLRAFNIEDKDIVPYPGFAGSMPKMVGNVYTVEGMEPYYKGVRLRWNEWDSYIWPLLCVQKVGKNNKPLAVGDSVLVYRTTKWEGWMDEMKEMVGKYQKVVKIDQNADGTVYLQLEDGFFYPKSCIKRS